MMLSVEDEIGADRGHGALLDLSDFLTLCHL